MLSITDREFRQLAEYIKTNYGIHLKDEKQTLLAGRLQHVLTQSGFPTFSDYYKHLLNDKSGDAVITLVNKVTTNHTFFMREAEHFHYFRDQLLPFLGRSVRDRDLRIWCAACSSGEEAYTLAMLLDQFFAGEKGMWDTKVLATDISENVLEVARKGVYSADRIAPLPPHWKTAYFRRTGATDFTIADKIRSEVIYRKFNLMEPVFPFRKKFHTIFCRNVMIYFDNETKTRLVNRFYDHMESGGYLFIGHSESLNRDQTKFKYVMPAVYRKE